MSAADVVEARLVELAREYVSAQRALTYYRDRDAATTPSPRELLTVIRQAPELVLALESSMSTTHIGYAPEEDGTARYAVASINKVAQATPELDEPARWHEFVWRRKATELLEARRPRLIRADDSLLQGQESQKAEVYAGR